MKVCFDFLAYISWKMQLQIKQPMYAPIWFNNVKHISGGIDVTAKSDIIKSLRRLVQKPLPRM